MSVCVFGADSNTSAAAFAEDEPCSFAEVDIAGNVPVQKPTEKEVKRMDKAQLKKDHPELFAEVLAEGKAQVVITADPEIKVLKEAVAALSEENKSLRKENDVRREKELKAEADKLFTEKLAASDLPERLHDKVKVMVDYNKFVKDQALNTKAFGEAVDAEIKDWSDRGVKKGEVVLGESTANKQITTVDKTEETNKNAERLLNHVQPKKK